MKLKLNRFDRTVSYCHETNQDQSGWLGPNGFLLSQDVSGEETNQAIKLKLNRFDRTVSYSHKMFQVRKLIKP